MTKIMTKIKNILKSNSIGFLNMFNHLVKRVFSYQCPFFLNLIFKTKCRTLTESLSVNKKEC